MLTFRDFVTIFRKLDLGQAPIIAHASLSKFGEVQGGADTMVGAMLSVFPSVIMPTFTYKTMITPETGPPNNGITYGSGRDSNKMAEFFRMDMPADPLMGVVSDTLRQHPDAKRSIHPIYSFAGVNADDYLKVQTLKNPFGPIEKLTEDHGWVLLLGVNHTSNTSIHFAEQLAGQKQFIRWALTPQGILECPCWPGCSYGFNKIFPQIDSSTKKLGGGQATIQAVSLKDLVEIVRQMIAEDPFALLCDDKRCERCNEIRK